MWQIHVQYSDSHLCKRGNSAISDAQRLSGGALFAV